MTTLQRKLNNHKAHKISMRSYIPERDYIIITLWKEHKPAELKRVGEMLNLQFVVCSEDRDGNPFVCYQRQEQAAAAD